MMVIIIIIIIIITIIIITIHVNMASTDTVYLILHTFRAVFNNMHFYHAMCEPFDVASLQLAGTAEACRRNT
jgi:hypothetical protein